MEKIVIPKERSDCGNLPFILLKNWHSDQKMRIFVVSSGIKNHKTDILKVFSQSLIENVEVFKTVGQRTTPISCIVMCDYAFLGIYPILFKCGVLYRLLLSGHSTTFD